MSESKRIEILSEQAVIDAKSLSHEWVSVRAAEVARFTWHGKWEMAQIEWGALSLTCLTINRALALIDAVIAHKLGSLAWRRRPRSSTRRQHGARHERFQSN